MGSCGFMPSQSHILDVSGADPGKWKIRGDDN